LKTLGEYSVKPAFIAACHHGGMRMTTGDLYRLAGDLAAEHGPLASDYASRAVMTMEAEGRHERAQFWFLMLILLADINSGRVDPEARITIH
jgi:hypothetical protein